MPRPPSDRELVTFKLSQADRDLLDALSSEFTPPNKTEVVRIGIRLFAARIERQKKSRKKS